METQVVKFDIAESAIAEMNQLYMGLVITDLEDKEQYDTVHDAHMIVRGKRIAVEKRATEQNAEALAWQKAVHGRKNILLGLIKPIESHLKDEKQKVKDEKQRKEDARKAAIKERIAGFVAIHNDLKGMGTADQIKAVIAKLEAITIEPDEFFEFTSEANEILADTLRIVRQTLETRKRLDKEDAERKAENERLAAEGKKQAEIAAKQKAAQDKIDAENRKIAEEKRTIRESTLKNLDLYRDGLAGESIMHLDSNFQYNGKPMYWNEIVSLQDSEFDIFIADVEEQITCHKKDVEIKADRERRDREEFERKAKEDARIQAEKDAEKERMRKEQEEADAEQQAKEDDLRREALKPDKEKLVNFGHVLQEGMSINYPEVSSQEAQMIIRTAHKDIYDVGEMILDAAEKL